MHGAIVAKFKAKINHKLPNLGPQWPLRPHVELPVPDLPPPTAQAGARSRVPPHVGENHDFSEGGVAASGELDGALGGARPPWISTGSEQPGCLAPPDDPYLKADAPRHDPGVIRWR